MLGRPWYAIIRSQYFVAQQNLCEGRQKLKTNKYCICSKPLSADLSIELNALSVKTLRHNWVTDSLLLNFSLCICKVTVKRIIIWKVTFKRHFFIWNTAKFHNYMWCDLRNHTVVLRKHNLKWFGQKISVFGFQWKYAEGLPSNIWMQIRVSSDESISTYSKKHERYMIRYEELAWVVYHFRYAFRVIAVLNFQHFFRN